MPQKVQSPSRDEWRLFIHYATTNPAMLDKLDECILSQLIDQHLQPTDKEEFREELFLLSRSYKGKQQKIKFMSTMALVISTLAVVLSMFSMYVARVADLVIVGSFAVAGVVSLVGLYSKSLADNDAKKEINKLIVKTESNW